MNACAHEEFQAEVCVNRGTKSDDDPTVISFSADIHVWCAECEEPFIFLGPPVGLLPNEPTISVDARELRAPLAPSSDPTFGGGLAGFKVQFKAVREAGGPA